MPDTRGPMRPTLLCSLCITVLSAPALAVAQAVPVLAVTVQDRPPPAELVARVAAAVGADARHGAALATALAARFGRYAPHDDVARAPREEVLAAAHHYFDNAPRARRRLEPAVRAFEEQRDALEARPDNREAYTAALMTLARIDLEAQHPQSADEWLRRLLTFDPGWTPPEVCPPLITQRLPGLRASLARATGTLTVRTPREGCAVTVDGVALPGAGRERTATVAQGAHRVAATCDRPSRIHTVTITADAPAVVALDPRLDGALALEASPGVVYPVASDAERYLVDDAAAVGAALDARLAIAVDAGRVRVIDVASRTVRATLASDAADLAAQLDATLAGRPHPVLATVVTPAAPRRVGPGVGPWILIGAAGAAAAAGAVFMVLRNGAFDDAVARCSADPNGVRRCDGLSADEGAAARARYDTAVTYNTAAAVSFGVAGAAAVGGALWLLLAPRSAPVVSASASAHGAALQARWSF